MANLATSGTGHWTIVVPSEDSVSVDDPASNGVFLTVPADGTVLTPQTEATFFPTVHLEVDLTSDDTNTINVVGDAGTKEFGADSIGFTAAFQIDVVNDTGHDLQGVTLNLSNADPQPLNLVPGVIEFGFAAQINANYAFFTDVQSNSSTTLVDPDGNTTSPNGIAPSEIVLNGDIPVGATVSTSATIHTAQLDIPNNDFSLAVQDIPTDNFLITDQTSMQTMQTPGQPYSGPLTGLNDEIIMATSDNINVTAETQNVFIRTGSGEDAIDVSGVNGTNVLDGGTGSNFLVGGTGDDTFFVDDRGAPANIWSTIKNLHSGDDATIFGVTQMGFAITTQNNQGAIGNTGLTFSFSTANLPNARMTLVGCNQTDLTNGKLSVSFGRTADTPGLPGSNFMLIHDN